MKKLGFLFSAALIMGLASCDDETTLGVMQTNPQLPVIEAQSINVSISGPLAAGAVDLAQYKETGLIPAISITNIDELSEKLGETATAAFTMQVSAAEDFSDAVDIELKATGNGSFAAPMEEWDNAFRGLLGKAPFAKPNYVRFLAYVNVGNQHSRVGSDNTYYGQHSVTVTPVDLNIVIEDRYYLVGTANGWDLATAIPFSHSDKSVYDDPVFTLSIDITGDQAEGGWWWKIVPASSFDAQSWDGLYGTLTDGDTATGGVLYANGQAGQLKTPGQQLFTIDMLNCTYSVTNAVEALWSPGQANDWKPGDSSKLLTNDFVNYTGFLPITGEFLLTPAPNWDNKYALGEGGEGTLGFNASSNLPMPAEGAGLYWMVVNLGNLTYNTTKIESIGMIGGFNGWGADEFLTPSEDWLTWTGTLTLTEASEWKFRCNSDWAINMGGSFDDLSQDGSNLSTEAGTYTVTLDLSTRPYTVTLTSK